jgi:leader peptidase (prepilin peptidase)/N-methyltransferase
MMWIWHIMAFVIGCNIGSFLNVCIWRIPRGESLITPPSHCPNCNHKITWYENLPLISWLCLRGKCSGCKNPISSRYFIVEFMTGLLFYMVWFKVTFDFQPVAAAVLYMGVTMLCVCTAFIDVEHRLIPNKLTYPTIIFGLAMSLFYPEIWGADTTHRASLIFSGAGLLIGGGAMALIAVIGEKIFKVEAMGWGDVKFIAAIGACLGLKSCFFILLIGSLLGSAIGIYQVIRYRQKEGFKATIPFGLYLSIATYLWILYGSRLEMIYHKLFTNIQI